MAPRSATFATASASVKNIQKITRAMEMVAAARLRRAEQRIEALRPYADAIRRMTRQAAEAAGGGSAAADPRRARAGRTASGCCWSPATAGWRARSTRNIVRAGRRRRARARRRGRRRRCTSPPGGVRRPRWLPRARARRELHRLHRPPGLRRRAPDRRAADGGLRRRRGRPGRDLLQRLHLADLAGRHAARRCCRCSRRRCSPRTTHGEEATQTPARAPGAGRVRARSRGDPRAGWCPTTSRSRSTGRCSSRPRPSTARG